MNRERLGDRHELRDGEIHMACELPAESRVRDPDLLGKRELASALLVECALYKRGDLTSHPVASHMGSVSFPCGKHKTNSVSLRLMLHPNGYNLPYGHIRI